MTATRFRRRWSRRTLMRADGSSAVSADMAVEGVEGDAEPVAADGVDPAAEGTYDTHTTPATTTRRRSTCQRIIVLGLLPAIALLLAAAAGVLRWQDGTARINAQSASQSVAIARDSTIAMLSYRPDTVDQQLSAARALLTGAFRDSYTSLTNDVVIPGAKQKQISAVATVPAAAPVSATADRAVVLVFVDQTIVVGNGAPTPTSSAVRVTLNKVDGRWLVSAFDPI